MSPNMQENGNPLLELFLQQLAAAKFAQAIKAAQERGEYDDGRELPRESEGSPNGSPRVRRGSGSVTSQEGAGSPQGSPSQHSPRESLSSSQQGSRSPRASPPPSIKHLIASGLKSEDDDGEILDFYKRGSPGIKHEDLLSSGSSFAGFSPLGLPGLTGPRGESPLDLSAPRKRPLEDPEGAQGKIPHIDFGKHLGFPMGFPLPPQLAYLALRPDLAMLAPELSKSWNGQLNKGLDETSTKLPPSPIGLGAARSTPSEASLALERMRELSKLGSSNTTQGSMNLLHGGLSGIAPNRATAWQSQWLSKGQDATRDVLKCVWCKSSFDSLSELTKHMKETKHCGVNLPPPMPQMPMDPRLPPQMNSMRSPGHIRPPSVSSLSNNIHGSYSSRDDMPPSIKENMPLPRKLVRGQDVWLGKGAEQTRQILKCMWCGQSFTSLQEMTTHMQKTQHYTNIVSQEQIISWKSPDDKTNSQQTVNAVLTCKVCDMSFSSLKELSDHMVKNAHYKEHVMRSISESGARRRQTRDKRKKSLPVRKLLELERSQHDMPGYPPMPMGHPGKDFTATGIFSCDKCEEKIEAVYFVEHFRNCVGTSMPDMIKPAMLSPDSDYNRKIDSPSEIDSMSEGKKTPEKGCNSPRENADKPGLPLIESGGKNPLSALGSLEKLIESSFDSRKSKVTQGGPLGSSLLRRLGIDESADFSKPIMEPQLQNMYSAFSRMHSGAPSGPSTPYTLNLPPSFGPDERVYGMHRVGGMKSPGMDSDTSDTFQRSPSRPGSRPESTGSSNRDYSANVHPNLIENPLMPKFVPIRLPKKEPESMSKGFTENGMDQYENDVDNPKSVDEDDTPNSPMDSSPIKLEPLEEDKYNSQESSDLIENEQPKEEIKDKEEFKVKDEREEEDDKMETGSLIERESPVNRMIGSPCSRSGTPHSDTSTGRGGSLGALAGMMGGVSGGGSGKSANPLAALQMFCDKKETQPRQKQANTSQSPQTNSGSLLAFSWACNDAVGSDSVIKCAFCDTTFMSKGAYRHHLSKMHFVKDGVIPEPGQVTDITMSKMNKPQQYQGSSKSSTPPVSQEEETPHSRFFKYTEMAKELSGK